MRGRRVRFQLLDDRFSHDRGTVAGVVPQKVAWRKNPLFRKLPVFFSHERMLAHGGNVPRSRSFGLLFESVSQAPDLYRDVEEVLDNFALVFTHSSTLLRRFPNTRWIPGGGVWIGGKHGGGSKPGIFPKTRNVSIMSSTKKTSAEHQLRFQTATQLRLSNYDVDVFQQVPGRLDSQVQLHRRDSTTLLNFPVPAIDYLRDYRYSIIVENYRDDLYFTEKILNCFATGTVPIYLGAERISSYFDGAGIIEWSSSADLFGEVLPRLGEADYYARKSAIMRNFELSARFRTIEDYIAENYLEEIDSYVL